MDYQIKRSQMISGIGEALERIYQKHIGKSGRTWMVAIQDNPGDNVYVSADPSDGYLAGYRGFRGFGGATLQFKLEDGTIEELQAPWHSNADALFDDTGIDARDRYETFVVVSKRREFIDYQTVMADVLYIDEKPQCGVFDRGDGIAKKFADELGKPVFLYSESRGGSSCGAVYPTAWDQKKIDSYWKEVTHD